MLNNGVLLNHNLYKNLFLLKNKNSDEKEPVWEWQIKYKQYKKYKIFFNKNLDLTNQHIWFNYFKC